MEQQKIVLLTTEQLDQLAEFITAKICGGQTPTQDNKPKRFVYGMRGICELFNVSYVTAHKYKNTFLAPAVMQRGKKIVVDADLALELYNNQHGNGQ